MGADHALVEDDAALGVDAGGDIGGRDLAGRWRSSAGPAAGSARAGRRCRRCTRNRAAAPPSCGSRRDNCRDADCRSAGCRKKCGSWGLASCAGRGVCYRRAPRAGSSRLPAGPHQLAAQLAPDRSTRAPGPAAANTASPGGDQQRQRASRSIGRAGQRRRRARRRRPTGSPPCPPSRRRSCAGSCGDDPPVEPEMAVPAQQHQQASRLQPARDRGQRRAPRRHAPEICISTIVSDEIGDHRRRRPP